jgi:Fic family protein
MIVSNDIINSMTNEITACQITAEIANRMVMVAESIGRLTGVNLVKPDPQLRRENRIRTIHASLAIEGNSLTREQVSALLNKKRVAGPRQDILEVQNAIAAYDRLVAFNPFSPDSLLEAHGILMTGLMENPGTFRHGPIGVLRENDIFHEALHWEKVVPMMQALFDYLNTSREHLLIRSGRFHFQLEHIHPFTDGNGRLGRLWQTALLMRYHPVFEFLPVEHLIREHQRDYYRLLAAGDDSGDCSAFVGFILSQVGKALDLLIDDTRGITHTTGSRLEIARAGMGEKKFSRRDYQNLFKTISTATASRDLQYGVETGVLARSGDKRTAIYEFKPKDA